MEVTGDAPAPATVLADALTGVVGTLSTCRHALRTAAQTIRRPPTLLTRSVGIAVDSTGGGSC